MWSRNKYRGLLPFTGQGCRQDDTWYLVCVERFSRIFFFVDVTHSTKYLFPRFVDGEVEIISTMPITYRGFRRHNLSTNIVCGDFGIIYWRGFTSTTRSPADRHV